MCNSFEIPTCSIGIWILIYNTYVIALPCCFSMWFPWIAPFIPNWKKTRIRLHRLSRNEKHRNLLQCHSFLFIPLALRMTHLPLLKSCFPLLRRGKDIIYRLLFTVNVMSFPLPWYTPLVEAHCNTPGQIITCNIYFPAVTQMRKQLGKTNLSAGCNLNCPMLREKPSCQPCGKTKEICTFSSLSFALWAVL